MRVVFLSYAYPPLKYPQSIQVSRLVRHLGCVVDVVCADDDSPTDPTIADTSLDAGTVHRLTWSNKPTLLGRFWHKLLPDAAKLPDLMRPWASLAAQYVIDQELVTRSDILVTFGMPMSDHLAGLEIKRRTGVGWIAHFSDPWVDNSFAKHGVIARWVNKAMEKWVVSEADHIVFVCEEARRLVMAKYAPSLAPKARVVSHAFDASRYSKRRRETNADPLVLRYIGDFYGNRTPEPLFRALATLTERDPRLPDRLRVELVGRTPAACYDSVAFRSLPENLIRQCEVVDYETSLALMVDAGGLLVIDAPSDLSVFLPSKLVDYIGACRPILGITPPGAAARLIKELGGTVADPQNPGRIAAALEHFISEDALAGGEIWGDEMVRARFEVSAVEANMANIVASLNEARESARH